VEHFNHPPVASARLQYPPLLTLKHQRCEHTRTKSTSVNANAVVTEQLAF